MSPQRIQLSRAKGWRMPANTIKVDRTTPFGNPFETGKHGTRADCVDLFRKLMAGFLCLTTGNMVEQCASYDHVKAHRAELQGKNLACWCPLDGPCHADVLLEIGRQ